MLKKFLYYFYHIREFKLHYIHFIKEYFFIKKHLYYSIEENLSIQKKRLFNMLNYAIRNVPYYNKIAQQRNIQISKETIFEDIKKFPVLTKEIIRDNWDSLHANLNKVRYTINTSGGTTGEPVKIVQTNKYKVLNFCSKIIFNEFGGYYSGDKLVKLWGNEKDILYMTRNKKEHIINKYFRNIIFQNSFKMSSSIINNFIKEINYKKPKVMLAYVQSVFEMAKYIQQNELDIHHLDSIITSAGVLTSKIRNYIESIFKTKVYNRYGSREVSVIGSSCEKSQKIHIDMFKKYIEILDYDNTSLGAHEKGNIIITDLLNYAMPLIRYKIGDRGAIDFSTCPCGRGLIRFDNILGRVVDIFKNEKGELIDGEYFTHLFYFKDNIKQFQVIQERINEIYIYLVMIIEKTKLDVLTENEISRSIRIVMGENCKVIFNYVDHINSSISGKFRYTISRLYSQSN
ncbi:MAG: phenylacetate--CoA ligase family protein [Promethearchaeota archaeon]